MQERLAALEERVAALESPGSRVPDVADDDPDDRFWALQGLAARVGRPASPGAVMMVGDVRTPAGDEARWQYGSTTDDVLATDWSHVAPVLAALGHPVRLALLRAVLDGARTARELADAVEVGSVGQVYHHLRQLQSAGWLRAAAGGEHVVPVERLVPLLTAVLAATR